jgi:lysophospholipase L1-like esterase
VLPLVFSSRQVGHCEGKAPFAVKLRRRGPAARGAGPTAEDFARRANELLILRGYFHEIGRAVPWCSPRVSQRCAAALILGRRRQHLSADMNGARIGLAVLLIGALAAGFSFLRKEAIADSHRQARQLVVHYTLNRGDRPIIVVGDSIVEASTLPRTLCGHPIVNAGLNGASTASDLGTWLIEALDGRRAAAIVVALGTNDALTARSRQQFETSYIALLGELREVTDHLGVLAIPAIDVQGRVTIEMQTEAMNRINDFNAALPTLAGKGGATFIALPPMQNPHTIDGVHLNAAGYAAWDDAILQGVSTICNSH